MMLNDKPIIVIIRRKHLHGEIIARLVKNWPSHWRYIIVSDSGDAVLRNIEPCIESLPDQLSLWIHDDAVLIIMNDDAVLVAPLESEVERVREEQAIGIVSLLPLNNRDCYSPDSSYTPDYFLGTVILSPGKLRHSIEKIVEGERWFGHIAVSEAIKNNISCLLVDFNHFLLPPIDAFKGTHILRSRKLAAELLAADWAHVVFSSDWILENEMLSKKCSDLCDYTILPDIDSQRKLKVSLDKHLSILTSHLLLKCKKIENSRPVIAINLENKNIIIFKIESIGDVVLSTPLLEEILKVSNHVTLVVTKSVYPLFENDKRYEKIISVDNEQVICLSKNNIENNILDLLDKIYGDYDTAIFPRYFPDFSCSHYLAVLLGIPQRVGLLNEQPSEGRYFNAVTHQMLTHICSISHQQHDVKKIASLAPYLNLPALTRPVLKLACTNTFPLSECTNIIFGLGAKEFARQWPVSRYIEVASKLQEFLGKSFQYVFIGGSDVELPDSLPEWIENRVGLDSLFETSKKLAKSRMYIGNDSGVMHIAAAFQRPIVEISMHPESAPDWHVNSPKRFAPWLVPNVVLQPFYGTDNRCLNGCVSNNPHCILQITVDDVVASVLKLFRATQ